MTAQDEHPTPSKVARTLRAAAEGVLFFLIAFSPWPFGSNDPQFEVMLSGGVLLLASLWSAHAIVTNQLRLKWDGTTLCLVGLIGWTAFQLVPLPESVVGLLSPTRLAWHQTYLPTQFELLPGETESQVRPSTLPLTIDPSGTGTFLARLIGVSLVFLIVRNWLATPASLRRFAAVMLGTGALLALFALVQMLTSQPGMVYWKVPVQGSVFGPFICRNHYPDYLALALGVSIGLLVPPRTPGQRDIQLANFLGELISPFGLGCIVVLGLMAASFGFSLSRGGILSAAVAAGVLGLLALMFRPRPVVWGTGLVVVAGAVFVVVGLLGSLGVDVIFSRLATLATLESADNRSGLWTDVGKLVPQFWLTGTGGGTFVWVESLVRGTRPQSDVVDHAHNEYLEAMIEGGLVRFLLTVAMLGFLFARIGRGYIRRRDRTVAVYLLGMGFGLLTLAVHSFGEFGIHMPAVALLAATVAAFATAAARDSEFITPGKTRTRTPRSTSGVPVLAAAPPPAKAQPPAKAPAPLTARRLAILALAVVSAAGAALDAFHRDRASRAERAANWVPIETNSVGRLAERSKFWDVAAAHRPHDAEILFTAGQARLDLAVHKVLESKANQLVPTGVRADHFPPDILRDDLVPALRQFRAARSACPIAPKPHTRLGLYAEALSRSEPGTVHFDRAKGLIPNDPDLWFTTGKLAFQRADWPRAWADWKTCLQLSPRHLESILLAASDVLPPWQILTQVLPEESTIVLAAAKLLYPDASDEKPRRLFLLGVIAHGSRPTTTADQLAAVAQAHERLNQTELAGRAWQRAFDADPGLATVRDGWARWLDSEERYAEAVPHLEWLLQRSPDSPALQDRLARAVRGNMLSTALDNPSTGTKKPDTADEP